MDKRIRVNAKSTSKGIWSFDVTVEIAGDTLDGIHPNVLSEIKHQEELFKSEGRTIAGDTSNGD